MNTSPQICNKTPKHSTTKFIRSLSAKELELAIATPHYGKLAAKEKARRAKKHV